MISTFRYAVEIMVDLRKQLLQAIERSGLTRKQIADKARISYSLIHRFCAGTGDVTLGTASKIINAIGAKFRLRKGR